jgi:mercuric ion binding protein
MKTLLAATAALSLLASPGWAASKTVTLDVPGMFCAACPITVKKALTKVTGVAEVNVDLDKKQAVVTFDDAKTSIATLTKATTNAGYPSTVKTK